LKKLLYWTLAENRVLREAQAVIFTSEEEKLAARESFWLYHCKEHVMAYGTSGPTGDREQQRRQFLHAHPHLEGKKLLLFLGRVHEKKGCELLLEGIAASLRPHKTSDQERVASLNLVIAGPSGVCTHTVQPAQPPTAQAMNSSTDTWQGTPKRRARRAQAASIGVGPQAKIAVVASALQEVEGKNVVFIRHSPTQFEKREVEKGVTVNSQTEIVRGLKPGEIVVTQGAFHLKSILAGGELGED